MNNKILFSLVISISILSCSKENSNDREWYLTQYPQDTRLYISYDINGKHYKFYQQERIADRFYTPLEVNATKELRYYSRDIDFDYLVTDENYTLVYSHPAIRLTFWNYMIDDKESDSDFINYYYFDSQLSNELTENYKYTSPNMSFNYEIQLKDTIFLNGIEMDYTSDVFENFDYDTTLINKFFSDEVYFTITDVEKVSSEYSMITGIFSTKSINETDTINIENGKFSFITQ